MNTMTDSKTHMTSAVAASPMSATPSFAEFVPVSYEVAAVVCVADMGADAAAPVVGGWVSPCNLTVVKQRTDVVLAHAICTRRNAGNATNVTKPANTQAKKWSMRPLGVQGVPPG